MLWRDVLWRDVLRMAHAITAWDVAFRCGIPPASSSQSGWRYVVEHVAQLFDDVVNSSVDSCCIYLAC